MSTDPIKAPMYNAWSNEGGGRDIEMQRRQSAAMDVLRLKAEIPREMASAERGAAEQLAEYQRLMTEFTAKYGTEAMANKAMALKSRDDGDSVTLSDDAKRMLIDLRQLDIQRSYVEFTSKRAAGIEADYAQRIAVYETLDGISANLYDANFTKDDSERLAAYKRFLSDTERLQSGDLAIEKRQGATGPSAPPKIDESGLFAVDARGNIQTNLKGLEKLGPEQQAIEQLKRLVTALTENNGLNQLRDGLIAALDGQNRTIADKAAALTAATKRDPATGG
jgi:hypothetical protein